MQLSSGGRVRRERVTKEGIGERISWISLLSVHRKKEFVGKHNMNHNE